jgi:hypothetical protein
MNTANASTGHNDQAAYRRSSGSLSRHPRQHPSNPTRRLSVVEITDTLVRIKGEGLVHAVDTAARVVPKP